MVTASTRITAAESDEAATKEDISLTPMAMPMLSGPGSIGVVMGLAANAGSMVTYLGMVIGITALLRNFSCYMATICNPSSRACFRSLASRRWRFCTSLWAQMVSS